jgi:hypothetical protein
LHSQTLTCQYNCPHVGEVFSTKTSTPEVQTSGLNQLWNFTQLQAVSTGFSLLSYVDPASTPSSSLFPQANVAKLESGNYTFLDTGNNGVKLISPSANAVNAESVLLPLPFSYGSTYTETVITAYLSGADTIKVTSIKHLNGVGTGTLMLPTGTFNDVLQISGQIVESSTKNGLAYGYVYSTSVYYYYSEKISYPLLYIEYKYDSESTDYAPFTQFVSGVFTGLGNENNEVDAGIMVAPNPTSDIVRVTTSINSGGEITLSNSLGVVLFDRYFSEKTTELDLSELPEGLYILLIKQQGNVLSKKIVLSR